MRCDSLSFSKYFILLSWDLRQREFFTFLRTDVFSFPNPGVILGRKPFIRLEGDNILPTSGDPSVYVFVVRLEANNVFFLLEDARRDAKPDCQNCRLLELSTVFLVGA